MADKKQWKPHAIMMPVPYQGHINPFINLVLKFASKGCAVTFIHLEHVHYLSSKAHHNSKTYIDFLSEEARESGFDIRYMTIDDGFPLEFDRNLHFDEYWEAMAHDFPSRVETFFEKSILVESSDQDPCLVPFIVADTSYTWPKTVAKKFNIVNVSFWTEPALVFSLIYQVQDLIENGHFPCKGNIEEEIIKHVPGIETTRVQSYLIPLLNMLGSQDSLQKLVTRAVEGAKKADFILHNTMHELEPETLSSLNKSQSNYAIGPTNFYKNLPMNSTSKSLLSESDCSEWLETKPTGSVLYVSFGSLVKTSKQVMEEIAYGLLLSGVDFIWVVREGVLGSNEGGILPDGFEDKITGKGLVVPWCDQVRVLSNRAVGGFLTHCGWNSTLESMWYGVPMICYPITFDQPTNRTLIVEDWKIGINLCDDGDSVDRNEVSEKIKYLMSGNGAKGLRQKVEKVKAVLHDAVETEGSSEKYFDRFLNDLMTRIQETSPLLR